MAFAVVDRGEYSLVKISGFLDGRTSESAEAAELLEQPSSAIQTHHVIDLAAVEYLNSSTIGMLVRFFANAQKAGYQVVLLKPGPSVSNVLDMTGLSHVLPIATNEDEISTRLQSAGSPPPIADDLDYDELEDEIETIIVKNDPQATEAEQLKRLRGED